MMLKLRNLEDEIDIPTWNCEDQIPDNSINNITNHPNSKRFKES